MVSRAKVENAVRIGLQTASGKPIDQAVQSLMDCLGLVVDIGDQPKASAPPPAPTVTFIDAPPEPGPEPAAVPPAERQVAIKELIELAPIHPAGESKRPRAYWDIAGIMEQINSFSPAFMDITAEGRAEPIKLIRTIQNIGEEGVQLAYVPSQGSGDGVPFPRCSFWVTDEELEIAAAVGKLTSQAEQMYKLRTAPIRQPVPYDRPISRIKVGDV